MAALNLSHIKKDHFCQEEVVFDGSKFMKEKYIFSDPKINYYENLVSCYRVGNILSTPFGNFDLDMVISPASAAPRRILEILYMAFFPLSILLALIPEDKDKTLTIDKVVVAHVIGEDLLPSKPVEPGDEATSKPVEPGDEATSKPDVHSLTSGKDGTLIINHLVIVYHYDYKKMIELSSKKESITKDVSKEFVGFDVSIEHCQLKKIDVPPDSLSPNDVIKKFLLDLPSIYLMANDEVEQISPHIMFATSDKKVAPSDYKERYQPNKEGGILIATLGYGYDCHKFPPEKVHETWPTGEPVDTHNGVTVHRLIDEYANNAAKFVICHTTNEIGIIVNGATAKAIK